MVFFGKVKPNYLVLRKLSQTGLQYFDLCDIIASFYLCFENCDFLGKLNYFISRVCGFWESQT